LVRAGRFHQTGPRSVLGLLGVLPGQRSLSFRFVSLLERAALTSPTLRIWKNTSKWRSTSTIWRSPDMMARTIPRNSNPRSELGRNWRRKGFYSEVDPDYLRSKVRLASGWLPKTQAVALAPGSSASRPYPRFWSRPSDPFNTRSTKRGFWAILGNARLQDRQIWHSRQRETCNLHIPDSAWWFESHPHRQNKINKLRRNPPSSRQIVHLADRLSAGTSRRRSSFS